VDNGPESSGMRTQFLKRMVAFADDTGKVIQLLYYPPYLSQIQSYRTVLGHSGTALEWDHAGRCRNDAGMGEKHDLERHPAYRQIEPYDLSERHLTVQESDAGD
jgi:hypothetical protein